MCGEDRLMQEWKEARDVLKIYDDRIHDLRKYGFTFVTGLLTVQGFLLPWIPPSAQQGTTGLPDEVKFGVLVATSLLIVVLRWFDGNYQGFQYGAAIRAIVIERFLNLELSDEISTRYNIEKLWLPKIILYFGFQAAVIGLALALLPNHSDWIFYLSLGVISESIAYYVWVNPQRLKQVDGGTDWAVDRLICLRGQNMRIMLTNLHRKKLLRLKKEEHRTVDRNGVLVLPVNDVVWRIQNDGSQVVYEGRMVDTVKVRPMSSYVWEWIANVNPGIYRIEVNSNDTNKRELARKIQVIERIPGQRNIDDF